MFYYEAGRPVDVRVCFRRPHLARIKLASVLFHYGVLRSNARCLAYFRFAVNKPSVSFQIGLVDGRLAALAEK